MKSLIILTTKTLNLVIYSLILGQVFINTSDASHTIQEDEQALKNSRPSSSLSLQNLNLKLYDSEEEEGGIQSAEGSRREPSANEDQIQQKVPQVTTPIFLIYNESAANTFTTSAGVNLQDFRFRITMSKKLDNDPIGSAWLTANQHIFNKIYLPTASQYSSPFPFITDGYSYPTCVTRYLTVYPVYSFTSKEGLKNCGTQPQEFDLGQETLIHNALLIISNITSSTEGQADNQECFFMQGNFFLMYKAIVFMKKVLPIPYHLYPLCYKTAVLIF